MKYPESPAFKQLKDQLREMFQLDRGDLDFGIYRIMNQKRGEVTKFLDEQLLPQVREILEEYQPASASTTQNELNKLLASLNDAGVDPETSPKVKELRAKLGQSVDINKLENEIYSDLYNFFKRYYSEGDFMSMRRYKEGVYALPYEGEEVKLHWANHDQYYIKTSEDLKNYSFKTAGGKKRVRFEVVAGGTETNNNKAAEGKERRFILHTDAPVQANGDELIIRFEYRPDDAKRKQDDLNKETLDQILNLAEATAFGLKDKAPSEKNAERTLLEKHLTDYTAKNSFDYFIHKDLGKFLARELDFFIKNEIIHLDDIENETAPKVETYLAKVKAMRKVAGKVIQFLAQLEDFQKKLWLKKKFVLETHYCVTLDHIIGSDVADELLPIIAANDAQREEWVKLFAIDELKGDLTSVAYSNPLTVNFLKANDKLLVDTKFFDANFKYSLSSIFDDLDEQTDGLLINSENFQALNLLQDRYREKVKCIYIDPPFNLGENGDFLYKTDYKDSTWATLLYDRISSAKSALLPDGMNFIRCDINGNFLVRDLADKIYNKEAFQAELLVQRIRKNVTGQGKISMPLANDSLFLYFKSEAASLVNPYLKLKETRESYWRRIDDSAGYRNPPEREIFGKIFKPYKYDAHFKYSQKSIDRMIEEGRIRLKCKSCNYTHTQGIWKNCSECNSEEATPQYKVEASDVKILDTNWTDIAGYSSKWGFSTENSETLLDRVIEVSTKEGDIVLDYFLGSGTTTATALKKNRKWLGIEVGNHFYDIPLRRMKKTAKDHLNKKTLFKYIILEQYEDALDNLGLSKSETQAALLASNPTLNEQYMLGYMLDVESRGSQSLLNIDAFADPFAYTLRITRNDDTKVVNVDLIETFNYLLGLTVRTVDRDKSGIVTVTGKNSLGENCLIIWRNVSEIDNAKLDAWFGKRYSSKDFEFDAIYVNGDNNIENMKLADSNFEGGHWKVRLIEAEFKRLMFDVQDV